MSKIKILTVSKDTNFKLTDKNLENVEVIKIENNVFPITAVYNNFLKDVRINQSDVDFILFMHADVDVDLTHLIKHIEECKDKYAIMGLCGTSIMNVSQTPLNWWTGSNPTPQAKWGCVTHGELGNQKSFFSEDRKDVTDAEVACIDGLCIVFGPEAIKSDILFDEQFEFDFYDTDISFQAVLNKKLKLGVIIEESLKHYSVGKRILTVDFLRTEAKFRQKWNLLTQQFLKLLQARSIHEQNNPQPS